MVEVVIIVGRWCVFLFIYEWQVTKRVDTDDREWSGWNWRTEGDIMVNGAFFVPSGAAGQSGQYQEATSVQAKSAVQIDQLTMYSGVLGDPRY